MTDSNTLEDGRETVRSEITKVLRYHCEPLPAPERADEFALFFDRFGDARVVLLGEATHGTSEFYRARAAITERLVGRHGFTFVAVEADWPDAARIDRYVRHREALAGAGEPFARFPTWMWRNTEVHAFADWLRDHNKLLSPDRRVSFHGLDIYSLSASIEAVINYLDKVNPKAALTARRRYGCLTPWQDEPEAYGYGVLSGKSDSCEDEAVAQLTDMLSERLRYTGQDSEAYFDAAQNARIVRAAEQYYRIMYRRSRESRNLRDRHMFETLQALLRSRGPNSKAVVWAHNSHIGNAAATAMGWQGEFNVGELCRTAYGDEAVLIGFGTDRGTVAAASDWGRPMEVKTVRPARRDSYEYAFRMTGLSRALTDWRRRPHEELASALREPLLERAIGVVYRPDTEYLSHYFEAVLSEQFDAYVWLEETHAVTSLPGGRPHGAPETYPFGL